MLLPPPRAACLAYLRAVGLPVYNFRAVPAPDAAAAQLPTSQVAAGGAEQQLAAAGPSQPAAAAAAAAEEGPPLELRYLAEDPLLRAGGLVRVSEAGRVWQALLMRQRAQQLAAQEQQQGEGGESEGEDQFWDDSGEDRWAAGGVEQIIRPERLWLPHLTREPLVRLALAPAPARQGSGAVGL